MNNICFIVAKKDVEHKITNILKEIGVLLFFTLNGKGSSGKLIDFGNIDKSLFAFRIDKNQINTLQNSLDKELKFTNKKLGVIFTLVEKGEKNMNDLVVTIITAGYAERIVELSREVGSSGATILSAKGTGTKFASYLGITVGTEKEIVLSVVDKKISKKVIETISKKINTEKDSASGICFAIPVENFVGINNLK